MNLIKKISICIFLALLSLGIWLWVGYKPAHSQELICPGEKLELKSKTLCYNETQYSNAKAYLKDKFLANKYIELQDIDLHFAVLDNEIKKRGGLQFKNLKASEVNIVDVLTKDLL